jgi:uncharacterized protein (DUF486 family)
MGRKKGNGRGMMKTVFLLIISNVFMTIAWYGFTVIAYLMFGETLRWNNLVSYGLIICAVLFAFAF